jgi:hypothetical protein
MSGATKGSPLFATSFASPPPPPGFPFLFSISESSFYIWHTYALATRKCFYDCVWANPLTEADSGNARQVASKHLSQALVVIRVREINSADMRGNLNAVLCAPCALESRVAIIIAAFL